MQARLMSILMTRLVFNNVLETIHDKDVAAGSDFDLVASAVCKVSHESSWEKSQCDIPKEAVSVERHRVCSVVIEVSQTQLGATNEELASSPKGNRLVVGVQDLAFGLGEETTH
jgi:hypothetical protein